MEVDPKERVARDVRLLLAQADRARAAGVVCLVDGRWLTVNVNLTVLHAGMPEPHPLELERHDICAFDVLLGRTELESVVAGLEQGTVTLPASCRGAVVPGTAHSHGRRFLKREDAKRVWRIDWPCDEVTVQGGGYQCDALNDRFHAFIEALPAMEPPIEGRIALCQELGVVGDLAVDRGGGHLYVRRPLTARLHGVSGTSTVNEIEITVEAYGPAVAEFTVSVMPDMGRRAARRIQAKDFEPIPGNTRLRRKRVIMSEPGPVKVSLAAREGEVADDADAGVPWAPMLIHEQLDPGCGLLRSLLFGPSGRGQKEQREFEKGVAWLLHLCGCSAMHLGRRKGEEDLQGSPDIVARTPGGDMLVGECSLRGPGEDKVGKLLERARSIKRMLHRAGVPSGVRAMFFVGEEYQGRFEGVEFVDVTRLRGMVERLRGGRPDGLCWL